LPCETGCSASSPPLLADHIPHAADRADQFAFEWLVDLVAEVAHVNVDDVRRAVKTLVPDVLDDHRPRKRATGVGHQIFKQGVFLSRQFDPLSSAPDLLRK